MGPRAGQCHWLYCPCREGCPSGRAPQSLGAQTPHRHLVMVPGSERITPEGSVLAELSRDLGWEGNSLGPSRVATPAMETGLPDKRNPEGPGQRRPREQRTSQGQPGEQPSPITTQLLTNKGLSKEPETVRSKHCYQLLLKLHKLGLKKRICSR